MASLGGGIAKGIVQGQTLKLNKQRLRQVEDEARAKAAEASRKRLQDALEKSKADAESAFEVTSEALVEIAPHVDDDDPRFQQLQRGALSTLMTHASVLQQMREAAVAEGAPQALVDSLPDPMAFIQSRLPVLEAQIASARLAKAAEPIDENSFFADVTGVGTNVRVTERDTPKGTKFFVGDKEVDPRFIGQPVQRQMDVNEFQIPGLTATQSGKEITALRQQIAAANSYAEIANGLAKQVSTPDGAKKVGTLADVFSFIGELSAQVDGLADTIGVASPFQNDKGQPISRDEALEEFDFGELAEESADVRRTLLDLVFLDLAAKGQTGRAVSDRDLAIFMRETGIKSKDPRQVIAGLSRGVANNAIQIASNVQARTGNRFTAEELSGGELKTFKRPGEGVSFSEVNTKITELIEAGDIAGANALMDAFQAGDEDKIRSLIGGGTE